jgi:hypothetical protein
MAFAASGPKKRRRADARAPLLCRLAVILSAVACWLAPERTTLAQACRSAFGNLKDTRAAWPTIVSASAAGRWKPRLHFPAADRYVTGRIREASTGAQDGCSEEAMQVVFDAKTLAAAKRRQAWRDAICEIYLRVDCAAEQEADYEGFVREMRFGDVTLTDALLSPQSVHRRQQHIAQFDKDYYYAGIEQIGRFEILQGGSSVTLRPGVGGIYYANEPYVLRSNVKTRQFWIELPREAFNRRFDAGRPPLLTPIDLGQGLGRIAAEFCSSLAAEGAGLDPQVSATLGEQFMDILAMALNSGPGRQPEAERSVQGARLRSVKAYIDANLG